MMEILKLRPAGKDYLWGGERLKKDFNKRFDLIPLAECWECSAHPEGSSYVVGGGFDGLSLRELLQNRPEFMGTKAAGKEFPILVKLIDACRDLSVQVHPDDDTSMRYEGQCGKTEMWYILDALEDSTIIYGFQHKVKPEVIQKALGTPEIEKYLQRVKAHKGDVYFVPAGTVHGIGAGILAVEVQENSNVTYRVYDYDRLDKDGQKRPLHLDKALQVMNLEEAPDVSQKPRCVHYRVGGSWEILCRCPYFEVEKITVNGKLCFPVRQESFQTVLCLEGSGEITADDQGAESVRLRKGDTVFLPAGLGSCTLSGNLTLLKIRC